MLLSANQYCFTKRGCDYARVYFPNEHNCEPIIKIFKDATAAWKERSGIGDPAIRRAVYDLIVRIKKEQQRSYLPSEKELLIQPALDNR